MTLIKCRLKKNWQRKGLLKQKGRCYLLLSLRQRAENLSCLFPSSCFSFYFVLLPWIPLLPCICFPSHFFCHHPSLSSLTCLSECQYIFLPSLCTLLPHYPFTACHSVTPLHLLDSRLFSLIPLTAAIPSLSLFSFCPPFASAHSQRLRRGDAPVPEWRNMLPEPEVHLSSRV